MTTIDHIYAAAMGVGIAFLIVVVEAIALEVIETIRYFRKGLEENKPNK